MDSQSIVELQNKLNLLQFNLIFIFVFFGYLVYQHFGDICKLLHSAKDGSTVRYATIFAKKYGTLARYAFFVIVQVRYVGPLFKFA